MPKVMTRCPETGAVFATQLEMGPEALARVRAPRAVYCRICRVGHIVEPDQLWLGSDFPGVHPLAATPWARRLGGGGATPATGHARGLDVSGEPILSPLKPSPLRRKDLTSR